MSKKTTKRFSKLLEKVDSTKNYSLAEAIDTIKQLKSAKFDETVEIALKLNVDPRHADQMVRGSVVLPAGTGKTVRVAVIAKDAKADEAKAAGADIVGSDELVEDIQKGIMNFDVLIATPNLMGLVGKVGRILGPKGLMPNPKAGTVTNDIEKAVKESKAGKVEYRVDKQAIVHIGVGKTNFTEDQLLENATAFLESLKSMKPASLKGQYIKSIFISTTMGPSIAVENIYN